MTADQLAADEQQAIVEGDVAEANKVAANVQVIKDDCQKVWFTFDINMRDQSQTDAVTYPFP